MFKKIQQTLYKTQKYPGTVLFNQQLVYTGT